MPAIKDIISKNLYAALAVAFVLGLAIGLPMLGWWLWPVQWTNAAPGDLTATYQREYVQLVADSYALNQNAELAKSRLGYLGDKAPAALKAAVALTPGAGPLRTAHV